MNTNQRVIYKQPYAQAMQEQLLEWGSRRVLLATNTSLSGPSGLANQVREAIGKQWTGTVEGLGAHAPRADVIRLVKAIEHHQAKKVGERVGRPVAIGPGLRKPDVATPHHRLEQIPVGQNERRRWLALTVGERATIGQRQQKAPDREALEQSQAGTSGARCVSGCFANRPGQRRAHGAPRVKNVSGAAGLV